MRTTHLLSALAIALGSATAANAAFVIEIDTDGLDDGTLTFSPNFSFGGDTTTASQSAPSVAVGTTGGDSIFGGDGSNANGNAYDPATADTYLYSYTPGTDADNFSPAAGTALNQNLAASGIAGGGSDTYAIWATWPLTTNVNPAGVTYDLFEGGIGGTNIFSTTIDQNGNDGTWVRLGYADLTAGTDYVLRQTAQQNSFVSQRAAAVMFEIPEPGTAAVLGLGGLALLRRRTA